MQRWGSVDYRCPGPSEMPRAGVGWSTQPLKTFLGHRSHLKRVSSRAPSTPRFSHPFFFPLLALQAQPLRAQGGSFAWWVAPAAVPGGWRCSTTGRGAQCATMAGVPPRAESCASSWAAGHCCRWHRELGTEKGRDRSGWMRSTALGRKGISLNAKPSHGGNTTVTTWRTPALSAQVARDSSHLAVHPCIPSCCTGGDAQLFSNCPSWDTRRIQHHRPGHPPAA